MTVGLRTLVLNSNYMPISLFPLHTIPVEDAITRVFNGTCHPVLEYSRKILTPKHDIRWPSVVARTDTKLVKERVKLSCETIYYRDHGMCQYCEKPLTIGTVTMDHVYPESKGGGFTWENIVSACDTCNSGKGDALPVGKWAPKQKPYKPSYFQLLSARKKFPIRIDDERWMGFIGNWEADVIVAS